MLRDRNGITPETIASYAGIAPERFDETLPFGGSLTDDEKLRILVSVSVLDSVFNPGGSPPVTA
ncbi:MAG: hypothetical protein LBS90_00635 [Oscillospiraceae bacterium]|nr:hypothetical protein [Oscillospiraceae bacterium]